MTTATPSAPIWTRLDGETPAAFRAFQAYLFLGFARSLIAAYRHARGTTEARQIPGTWKGWAKKYEWARRAQAYDDHVNALIAERLEGRQADRFARMREASLRLSEANLAASIRLLRTAGQDLEAWEAKMERHHRENPDEPLLSLRELAAVVRAAGVAASAALDAQAAELGIAELMQALGLDDPSVTPSAPRSTVRAEA